MGIATRPLERVVVGIDFSAASIAAAARVVEWLDGNVEVVLVHATPTADPLHRLGPPRAERRLREIANNLSAEFVWCEVRTGDVADVVLAVAAEYHADHVVLGASHGSLDCGDRSSALKKEIAQRSELPVVVADELPAKDPYRSLPD